MQKLEYWRHENVSPDGSCVDGSVNIEGAIRLSDPGGGNSIKDCHSSDGHWFMLALPRTDKGLVEGFTLRFGDRAELTKFIDNLRQYIVNKEGV